MIAAAVVRQGAGLVIVDTRATRGRAPDRLRD
ncbi:hypothetical protein ABIE67_008627 [Streptomyces sp. V4I8]